MSDYNPFYDDVKERNAMKSGAFHKVKGSKSKRCTLPSDNLTPAQKRKMNGPVKEYELHKAMSWKEFKALPVDLQQVHIDYIQRRFRVGATTISTEVFELSQYGLSSHMKAKGLTHTQYVGKHVSDETREAIRKWKLGLEDTPPAPIATDEPIVVPDAVPTPEESAPSLPEPKAEPTPAKAQLTVSSINAHVSGNAKYLLAYLGSLLGDRDADVRIEINYKEEMNNEK